MHYWKKLPWWIIFALLLAIGCFHWDWIKFILTCNSAPAWAQVFSALISVLIAIWIATSDARNRENAKSDAEKRDRAIFIGKNKALIASDLIRLNTVAQNLK